MLKGGTESLGMGRDGGGRKNRQGLACSEGSWLGKGRGGSSCLRAEMAPSALGTFNGAEE